MLKHGEEVEVVLYVVRSFKLSIVRRLHTERSLQRAISPELSTRLGQHNMPQLLAGTCLAQPRL